MQEREVTVGQETLHLPDPFFVIATQNPIEQEGTYPLPEAQLDRFMFDIRVGYPTLDEEKKILSATTKGEIARPEEGALGQGDRQPPEAGHVGADLRLRGRVRDPAGPGHPAGRREGAAVHQGPGRLRRRPARRPEPDPRRQGDGRDGRPVQRLARRHPQGGRPGPPPPDQHQLPGPGRGPDDREPHQAAGRRDPRARRAQVRAPGRAPDRPGSPCVAEEARPMATATDRSSTSAPTTTGGPSRPRSSPRPTSTSPGSTSARTGGWSSCHPMGEEHVDSSEPWRDRLGRLQAGPSRHRREGRLRGLGPRRRRDRPDRRHRRLSSSPRSARSRRSPTASPS